MVSVKATVVVIALIFCLLASDTSAVSYGCCRSYTKGRISFKSIKGYSVQTTNEVCHINAIIFHTKQGLVCTNPALNWVMDYVDKLRNRARKVHINSSQHKN